MLAFFRHIAPKRCVTALLLPFVLVFTHGSTVAWVIYFWEWEDIVTHYCQEYSTAECDGKAFVNAVLEHKDGRYPALPHAPQNIQEMRSVAARVLSVSFASPYFTYSLFPQNVLFPHRGFLRGVFRPPCSVV